MKNDRTLSNRAKLSIEAYISPDELRGAHNFATAAQPIMSLELESEPAPPDEPPEPQEASSSDDLSNREVPETQSDIGSDHGPEAPSGQQPPTRFDIQPRVEPLVPADTPPEVPIVAPPSIPTVSEVPAQSSALVPQKADDTDFLIETRLTEPDPPFRAPTSWQVKHPQIGVERQWHWSERSTAAFLGFAAGVLIIVPLVVILSMTTEQPLPPAAIETVAQTDNTVKPPAAPVIVAGVAAGSRIISRSPETTATPAAERSETTVAVSHQPAEQLPTSSASVEDAANKARSALAQGQLSEARAALRIAASPDNPQLWFVLAETYDPLVVRASAKSDADAPSSFNPSDKLTAADIKFAQFYYQQALTHGIRAARARLAALEKP